MKKVLFKEFHEQLDIARDLVIAHSSYLNLEVMLRFKREVDEDELG